MKLKSVSKIGDGQDGAFWGDYLFRFHADGRGQVWDARGLDTGAQVLDLIAEFSVDSADALVPHFNAVSFGNEYFAPGDEFPLLYANLYNNYAKASDRREGTCCVYRIVRKERDFSMTLVQVIRVGFARTPLWLSSELDVRPYGNFVIDTEKSLLHAFTMRDADRCTRFFSFRLPKLSEGVMSEELGVRLVTLTESDILEQFDTEYHLFLQGACCHGGLIYSSEGFNVNTPPSLRVIDPAGKKQLHHTNLLDLGVTTEAEWIDFRGGQCYYCDSPGTIYQVDFEL